MYDTPHAKHTIHSLAAHKPTLVRACVCLSLCDMCAAIYSFGSHSLDHVLVWSNWMSNNCTVYTMIPMFCFPFTPNSAIGKNGKLAKKDWIKGEICRTQKFERRQFYLFTINGPISTIYLFLKYFETHRSHQRPSKCNLIVSREQLSRTPCLISILYYF